MQEKMNNVRRENEQKNKEIQENAGNIKILNTFMAGKESVLLKTCQ
jgi:hypothetical protein